ncbi:MAG TPA: Na+/H+ antiporter NhaC [Gammaproteobacteria bacterium]|nr:Na+/H+ antiporter NhaC [Gammaproteobacteria bacterium]
MSDNAQHRAPSMLDAVIPVISLVLMLIASVTLYGADSSYGPNQIALLLAAGIAAIIGIRNGMRWKQIEDGIISGIAVSLGAMLILLAVGSLIAAWILAGTVPTLIYYGLILLHPAIFYPATCLICAIVGSSIGSSWTVAGTLGIAFIGVATALGLSPAVTAGAIISGAYFGDKISPLSDTTNLAPAVAGSELFSHIRHMLWTTLPSLLLAMILFGIVGIFSHSESDLAIGGEITATLDQQFRLGWYLLLPLVLVIWLAARKFPAFPTIMIGALVGVVFAVIFQPDQVVALANNAELSRGTALLSGAWTALANGYVADTGNAAVDELLSRGGMVSMLNTVWLILCALTFGAVLEVTGILATLLEAVLKLVRGTGSLIVTTILTCIGSNVIAADQYMSIVLPGRLYRLEFERRGLAPVNLSRALEDGATITSPLVPWNTCGAFMAGTLGVPTLTYLPFCFFNLINPLLAMIYALAGFRVTRINGDAEVRDASRVAS